jgi:hypothetical protein
MRAASGLALLLVAGCGGDGAGGNRHATENQLERLAMRKAPAPDPSAMARLRPLRAHDPIGAPPGTGGCTFSLGREIFLISTAGDTIARVENSLRHFVHAAPIGDTGGFFEDRQISISVGRTDGAATPGGRARLIVTNRRAHTRSELDGIWTCDPHLREF